MDVVVPQRLQQGGSHGTTEELESEGDEESPPHDMSLGQRCMLVKSFF